MAHLATRLINAFLMVADANDDEKKVVMNFFNERFAEKTHNQPLLTAAVLHEIMDYAAESDRVKQFHFHVNNEVVMLLRDKGREDPNGGLHEVEENYKAAFSYAFEDLNIPGTTSPYVRDDIFPAEAFMTPDSGSLPDYYDKVQAVRHDAASEEATTSSEEIEDDKAQYPASSSSKAEMERRHEGIVESSDVKFDDVESEDLADPELESWDYVRAEDVRD